VYRGAGFFPYVEVDIGETSKGQYKFLTFYSEVTIGFDGDSPYYNRMFQRKAEPT
jgi:hypothetical protein